MPVRTRRIQAQGAGPRDSVHREVLQTSTRLPAVYDPDAGHDQKDADAEPDENNSTEDGECVIF